MELLVGFGSPAAVGLWAIACAAALWWVARQARSRSLVTVPTYLVVFWFFLPILIQYPFAFSPINALMTGAAFSLYPEQLDRALFLSVTGMAVFALAFRVCSKRPRPNALTVFIARGLSAWSQPGLLWATSLAVIALLGMLAVGLLGPGGMRVGALESPYLRPLYNLVATVFPLLTAIVLLAAAERREPALWVLALLLILAAALTGSRGVAFGGILSYALTMLCYRGLRGELDARRVATMLVGAAVGLLLVFYLGDVRDGRYNILGTLAGFGAGFFYGNNFSDLRDFAWLLAYWDGEWLGGRTQLAGLLGFVPAAFSPFRAWWGWGRVSTDMVGLATREVDTAHGGLRPGVFGELYFNFGVTGIVLGALLLGYCAVRLHAATRDAVQRYGPFEAKLVILAAFTALGLLFNLYITAALFGVYVILAALAITRLVKGVVRASLAGPSGRALRRRTLSPEALA